MAFLNLRPIALSALALTLVVGGCEGPFDRTPSGYVEACYGGKAAEARNWVCADDRLIVTTSGSQAEWPQLARSVQQFGAAQGLATFDTSTHMPDYIDTVEVSVCSDKGMFLLLDKRVYKNAQLNRNGDDIQITMRTYRSSYEWRPLAEAFVADLQATWPHPIKTSWPAAIPAEQKNALPDSVRSCVE